MSKPAQDERIRVSIRLRPVSRDEAEAHPPPWPVQPAEGEVRIFSAARAPRPPTGDKGQALKLALGSSGGGCAPLTPRAPSPHSYPGKAPQQQQALAAAAAANAAGLAAGGGAAGAGAGAAAAPAAGARGHSRTPSAALLSQQLGQELYQSYLFSSVFGAEASGEEVYDRSGCRDVVESACQGCNGTVFLYGQTGSGKTYTHEAITAAAVSTVFGPGLEEGGRELAAVTLSVVEIYCEQIRCLLTGRPVALRQAGRGGGVLLEGAGEQACTSEEETLLIINAAKARRAIGETRANARSSRSHLVVRLRLEVLELAPPPTRPTASDDGAESGGANVSSSGGGGAGGGGAAASGPSAAGAVGAARGVAFGVLNLVDLAGSERVEKSGSAESKALMREALNINKSLLCLGNVVNALAERAEGKKVHVPYRDSKLTRLLEDALGGSARTALVACATPLPGFHLEQTRATLDFAARAANVVCTPRRNVLSLEPAGGGGASGSAAAEEMGREVERLRAALAAQAAECEALRARLLGGGGGGLVTGGGGDLIWSGGGGGGGCEPASSGGGGSGGGAGDGPLERLKRLSIKRAPGRAAPGCAGGSGAWGGPAGPGALGSGGAVGDAAAAARGGGGGRRLSSTGVAPAGSLIWRMLHPGRAAVDGLGSLLSPPPPPGALAARGAAAGALLLHTTGSFLPAATAPGGGGGGGGGGGAAARVRRWATLGGHEGGQRLRRYLSIGGGPPPAGGTSAGSGGAAVAPAARAYALLSGGSAGRRATESDCAAPGPASGRASATGYAGAGVAAAWISPSLQPNLIPSSSNPNSAASRDASLREHIIRSLVQLLQQKKGEVRQLKETVADLTSAAAAAAFEAEAKEARLRQMVEGVSRLGAARQEEFAKWSQHLRGLEGAVADAQREALAYREEAAALQVQLAAAAAKYNAQAEQLRRTSLVVLQTGHALSDAKGKGAAALASCVSSLAAIKAALEAGLAQQQQQQQQKGEGQQQKRQQQKKGQQQEPGGAAGGGGGAVSGEQQQQQQQQQQQLELLQSLIPQVKALLDQHREQVEQEARHQAAAVWSSTNGGGTGSSSGAAGGASTPGGGASGDSSARGGWGAPQGGQQQCAGCQSNKPLLAYMQKLKDEALQLRAAAAAREARIGASVEESEALRGDLAEARAHAAELEERLSEVLAAAAARERRGRRRGRRGPSLQRSDGSRRGGGGGDVEAHALSGDDGEGGSDEDGDEDEDEEDGRDADAACRVVALLGRGPSRKARGGGGGASGSGAEGLMGPSVPLEQLHFQILNSWAALAVPHHMRAAAASHVSWRLRSHCQAHVALLACLHQLYEDAPERAERASEALREEARVMGAGLAAMPEREFEAACRAVGVPDGLHSGEARRQLLDRLWRAPRPAAAGAAAAAAAAAVAGALKYAQPEALCAAQQRGTGDFLAAAGLALRDAALG